MATIEFKDLVTALGTVSNAQAVGNRLEDLDVNQALRQQTEKDLLEEISKRLGNDTPDTCVLRNKAKLKEFIMEVVLESSTPCL